MVFQVYNILEYEEFGISFIVALSHKLFVLQCYNPLIWGKFASKKFALY